MSEGELRRLLAGRSAAEAGQLITFGIVPTAPETGYGYIEAAQALAAAPVPIARFVEKPNRAKAEEFLATGRFTWADIGAMIVTDFARVVRVRAAEDYAHIGRWHKAMSQRPSFAL